MYHANGDDSRTCLHIYKRIHACLPMHVWTHTHAHTHTRTRARAHTHTHTFQSYDEWKYSPFTMHGRTFSDDTKLNMKLYISIHYYRHRCITIMRDRLSIHHISIANLKTMFNFFKEVYLPTMPTQCYIKEQWSVVGSDNSRLNAHFP